MTIHIFKNSPKRPTAKWSIYLQRYRQGVSFNYKGEHHALVRFRHSGTRGIVLNEDERFAVAIVLRDWIHTRPELKQCDRGSDTCDDWPLAFEIRNLVANRLEEMQRQVPAQDMIRWVRVGMFERKLRSLPWMMRS